MGKDRPIYDVSSGDRHGAFKYFVANFRDFCVIEDYFNPAKPLNSQDYWISTKRLKAFCQFGSDIISHEDLTLLTFAQAISKARDVEASILTASSISQQHLEEGAHKVTPAGTEPKLPPHLRRRPPPPY